MDEKINEALNSVFEKLTEEQKERAKRCKDPDELMVFLGKEGVELPDDIVDAVAGGGWVTFIPPEVAEQLSAYKTVTKK